jgi:hypothetical protein
METLNIILSNLSLNDAEISIKLSLSNPISSDSQSNPISSDSQSNPISSDSPSNPISSSDLILTDSPSIPISSDSPSNSISSDSPSNPISLDSPSNPISSDSQSNPISSDSQSNPISSDSQSNPISSDSQSNPISSDSPSNPISLIVPSRISNYQKYFIYNSQEIFSYSKQIGDYDRIPITLQSEYYLKYHKIGCEFQKIISYSKHLISQINQIHQSEQHNFIQIANIQKSHLNLYFNNLKEHFYNFFMYQKQQKSLGNKFFQPESDSNLIKLRYPYIFKTIAPNQDINIDLLTCGLIKKIKFICLENSNHQFEQSINSRINSTFFCKLCSAIHPKCKSIMDVKIFCDEYAWDLNIDKETGLIINPYPISLHSLNRINWRCTKHVTCNFHIWDTPPCTRIQKGHVTSCLFCINQKTCPCNSIIHIERLRESYCYERNIECNGIPIPIESIAPHSNIRCWWECKSHKPTHINCKGHFWICKPTDRINDNTNCPFCADCGNKQTCPCNSFMNNELLAKEYNKLLNVDSNGIPIDGWTISSQSSKKLWWICCQCGYEWKTQVHHRNRKIEPTSCPNCVMKRQDSIGVTLCKKYFTNRSIKCIYEFKILYFLPLRRYDFFFEINSIKYILEFDGRQHFALKPGWCDDEEDFKLNQEIDKIKNYIAMICGINIIRIHNNNESFITYFLDRILSTKLGNNTVFLAVDDKELYKHMFERVNLNMLKELRPNNLDELIFRTENLNYQVIV